MTVHHDKMAYGRLASLKEDASLDKLGEMADKLNAPRSEREKMLSGELYNVADAELTQLRRRARKLFFSFNNTKRKSATSFCAPFSGNAESSSNASRPSVSITAAIRR